MEQNVPERAVRYPWFEVVDSEALEQGDLLFGVPVVEPVYPEEFDVAATDDLASINVTYHDVIVLSQTCDLLLNKLENVIVSPHFTLTEAKGRPEVFRSAKGCEDARRGYLPAYHMIESCDLVGFGSEVRIVAFAQVFTIPLSYARKLTHDNKRRLRLLPPYREHLSQAFARFVMRVGLPLDIRPFK